VKKQYISDKDYNTKSISSQNQILSKNLSIFQNLEKEKKTKAYFKTKGKKQLLLSCDWISPKKEVVLNRQYFTNNQKNKKLENILDELRKEYFIIVKNQGLLFKEIERLPMVYMGRPFFTFLNVISAHKKVNMQVNWKVSLCMDRHYLQLMGPDEQVYYKRPRENTLLDAGHLDFDSGEFVTPKGLHLFNLTIYLYFIRLSCQS
jgi:hypothetical protein